ncbi:hypothetical protein BD310DRAFT_727579 [Dichomitus squalens]|uniref:Uncharacterized protein n=1 Tax=Dichomitus squalens TaxID=114155 RepID=A0A4V2K753_9APHY|nr:hypothetical protein BD310DRAFT_727579 [Dichomitus squalens]
MFCKSILLTVDVNASPGPYYLHATLRGLKNASQSKQEAATLEVENAEGDLIQNTEVAITLMTTILKNFRSLLRKLGCLNECLQACFLWRKPLKNLDELAKSQVRSPPVIAVWTPTPSHSSWHSSYSMPPTLSRPYKARSRSLPLRANIVSQSVDCGSLITVTA